MSSNPTASVPGCPHSAACSRLHRPVDQVTHPQQHSGFKSRSLDLKSFDFKVSSDSAASPDHLWASDTETYKPNTTADKSSCGSAPVGLSHVELTPNF